MKVERYAQVDHELFEAVDNLHSDNDGRWR